MKKENLILIKKYFEENGFVESSIASFNSFVEWRLAKIIEEQKEMIPAVIPPDVEEIKFEFGQVRITKPVILEADGSERPLLPAEARIRNLTYAAQVFLEIGMIIDGKERERAEVLIAELPIMVKSKFCHLYGKSKKELIELGEDPNDPGGYFIIDGTERVLVLVEDLAPNTIFVRKETSGSATHTARVFSQSNNARIPVFLERTKDGLFVLTFSGLTRIPFVVVVKALGVVKDKEILELTGLELNEDIYINLYEFIDIKSPEEAQEFIARSIHLALPKERKLQRIQYILDNMFLPHLGTSPNNRIDKVRFLGRMVKRLLLLKEGKIPPDDQDHYMNKRVRMPGDLLEDLFRKHFKEFVNDMLYIFQRGVRRGKLIPISSMVRSKFLTQRIKSAMATGKWTGDRVGLSQRLERDNKIGTLSHLRRVMSLIESTRESFEARELHPTHWGRLCPLESPEGKNIGLRKNLSLLASITPPLTERERKAVIRELENLGLKRFK